MAILSVGFQRGSHIDIGFLFNKKKKRIKTGADIRNIGENYKKYKLEKIGVRGGD